MKQNAKKKIITLMLVIVLLSIAIASGSLAWFTAEDEVTNAFTVGSIEIKQHEKQHNESGQLVDFKQDKVLRPVLDPNNPTADPYYAEKIVTVENTGKNDAYVRTHIAIPTTLVNYLILDLQEDNWTPVTNTSSTVVDGLDYTVYSYDYHSILQPGTTTTELLKGVYLDAKTDLQMNPDSKNMEFCYRDANTGNFVYSGFVVTDNEDFRIRVLVATQAVQVEGFADAQTALNTAFEGKIPTFGA